MVVVDIMQFDINPFAISVIILKFFTAWMYYIIL